MYLYNLVNGVGWDAMYELFYFPNESDHSTCNFTLFFSLIATFSCLMLFGFVILIKNNYALLVLTSTIYILTIIKTYSSKIL